MGITATQAGYENGGAYLDTLKEVILLLPTDFWNLHPDVDRLPVCSRCDSERWTVPAVLRFRLADGDVRSCDGTLHYHRCTDYRSEYRWRSELWNADPETGWKKE